MKLLVAALFLAGSLLEASAAEAPVCKNEDDCCSIYVWNEWAVAGQDLARNQVIGNPGDVVVPLELQSTRPFPLFGRHKYFLHKPPDQYVFAPAFNWPLTCHTKFANIRSRSVNVTALTTGDVKDVQLQLNRALKVGDPLYLECFDDDLDSGEEIQELPKGLSVQDLEQDGFCLDGIGIDASGSKPVAIARKPFAKGKTLMQGQFMHLHRAELVNDDKGEAQLLLNYCFGHPQTDLLLLPVLPVVNRIQHAPADKANVKLEWVTPLKDRKKLLNRKLSESKLSDEEAALLQIAYVATRDIQQGEDLFLDFGEAWSQAYDAATDKEAFRHEIGLPPGFLPQSFLDLEERGRPFEAFDARKLKAGEVQHAQLGSGAHLGDYQHRVGLTEGLADSLEQWVRDTGLMEVFENYILNGMALEIDGEERTRVNGGNWWLRRFDGAWHSDMHYITPDDDESNEQYFKALGEAGFDEVLAGIGEFFGLESLSAFYPSFIAVSHCVHSYLHSDSDDPRVFNMIFPILQVNNSDPELVLADDKYVVKVPYRYERDAGILVGLDGIHGTAPCDYRGTGEMRVVASIYMGDFRDDNVDEYVDAWEDPPYPRHPDLRDALTKRIHWKKGDPSVKIGNPMPPSLSRREETATA